MIWWPLRPVTTVGTRTSSLFPVTKINRETSKFAYMKGLHKITCQHRVAGISLCLKCYLEYDKFVSYAGVSLILKEAGLIDFKAAFTSLSNNSSSPSCSCWCSSITMSVRSTTRLQSVLNVLVPVPFVLELWINIFFRFFTSLSLLYIQDGG